MDLARFSWEEENEDHSTKIVITNATIWVGVYPNSTTPDVAYECCNDILNMLNELGISDIDVAFRESIARPLRGPALYTPVDDLHHLTLGADPHLPSGYIENKLRTIEQFVHQISRGQILNLF